MPAAAQTTVLRFAHSASISADVIATAAAAQKQNKDNQPWTVVGVCAADIIAAATEKEQKNDDPKNIVAFLAVIIAAQKTHCYNPPKSIWFIVNSMRRS